MTETQIAEPLVIWPRTESGAIVNLGVAKPLQEVYQAACEASVEALLAALPGVIRAIYVRGSVAIANGTPPYSDLDLLVITRGSITFDPSRVRLDLLLEYPRLEDVDIAVIGDADIGVTAFGRKVESYLAIEARCLWGEELDRGCPAQFPDARLAATRFPGLEAEVRWLSQILSGAIASPSFRDSPRSPTFWAKWAMRLVLRATHLLAMTDTGEYSNHLGTCRTLAARRFPDCESWLAEAYENERLQESDPDRSAAVLKLFSAAILPRWRNEIEPLK